MSAVPGGDGPVDAVPFGDGLLLHQRVHRTVHVLNASAATVWEHATGTDDPAAVVDAVAAAVGLAPGAVAADARRTIDELGAAGLLDEGPSPAPRPHPPAGPPPAEVGIEPGDDDPVVARALHVVAAVHGPTAALAPLRPLLAGMAVPAGPATAEVHHRLRPVDGASATWRLEVDGRAVHGPATLDSAHRHLLWHLNHTAIVSETEVLLLHAGATAGSGGAVLVGGEPDAGKSTLTAALCRAGLAYLTDEAAPITLDGRVLPYPKALTLDPTSLRLLGLPTEVAVAGHVAPAALGPVAEAPAALAAVVLPARRPGALARLERLTPTEAALALAGVAFNLPATGRSGLATLAAIAGTVPVHRAVVDDLDEATALVGGLVGLVAR